MFSPFPIFAGFALPKWASSAFSSLIILIGALILERAAPMIGKVIVGFLVVLYSVLILFLPMLFGSLWGLLRTAFHFDKLAAMPPTPSLPEEWKTVGGAVWMAQTFLFWIWGIFYVAGDHIHLLNRIALIVWTVTFLAGCLVAFVNGVSKWIRLRRRPPGTT